MTGARHADRWVVAIGGNALADPHDPAALAHQGEKAAALAGPLLDVLASGKRLVIVHGNGPQVGARLIQNEAARDQVPPLPLHICVAETQGQIGHYLSLALLQELGTRGLSIPVVCLVTHVTVDPGAAEFTHPDKPVGPVYAADEASHLAIGREWKMTEVVGGGCRRVVPSPRPLGVVEGVAIERLIADRTCVIAGGGGGIPVASGQGGMIGVDAVVDKDYTAERIATAIGASRLVILTDVPGAALSFATPQQQFVREMHVREAREHLERGEFAPGSMAPKAEACIEFLEAGGEEAVIAATSEAGAACRGAAGTRITVR